MPDKLYWDRERNEEVILPSDYFVCNRCLGLKFAYELNHLFLSGESTKKWKQTCLSCGEVFFSDKRYFIDEKDRFKMVVLSKRKKESNVVVEKEGVVDIVNEPEIPKITPKKKRGRQKGWKPKFNN